ncbi:MAG: YegS/Rv2252/BmrU family lipid kinase [Oscillospiraceae bacterium]|nr:YegS/Rv2252/BmrU family lipid kinase [Oscillospiraceae bacterium]
MKHLFIINPVAGGNRSRFAELRSEISAFAESLQEPGEVYVTKAPMDAARKVAEHPEADDMLYVYACGGDGTLNECANGAASRANVAVTQYSCGTGNDFIKTFGQENLSKFKDLAALAGGTVRPLDLIECNGRYGVNICSVGIDARVGRDVHKYSSIPIIGGSTGYIVALLANVLKGITQKVKITFDGKTEEKLVTLVCACNGRFYGGGFNPVPDALPDDGVLEFLIVSAVSRLKVAQIVGRYAKGRHKEFPDIIKHVRGGNLEIESEREIVVNIDGEIVHTNSICFRLVPKGINFIFPEGMQTIPNWKHSMNK